MLMMRPRQQAKVLLTLSQTWDSYTLSSYSFILILWHWGKCLFFLEERGVYVILVILSFWVVNLTCDTFAYFGLQFWLDDDVVWLIVWLFVTSYFVISIMFHFFHLIIKVGLILVLKCVHACLEHLSLDYDQYLWLKQCYWWEMCLWRFNWVNLNCIIDAWVWASCND